MTIPLVTLNTARLELLPAEPGFARALLAFELANRDHFARWDPNRDAFYFTELHLGLRLRQYQREAEEGRGAAFLLTPKGEPQQIIGQITLSQIVRGVFQAAYLGYRIDARYEGQGLMREALAAVLAFALDTLRLHRIMANYQPDNERSARLLARCGFRIEGLARDYLFLNGAWRDHVLTALTNPDPLLQP
ncbi:GNAT family N-acetyltransferase [Crenobacter sp. SG2305]|uniref:GNAT family N-acetyltransferase n=1 Tax=Crenobacter oryzisoli TaxID=3056844 RepID=UPI0025AAFC4F|nr:GNAT family N-acetyltransferase [Crenobacter sp. SG2305]MDN0083511.1 GNAT family N-acetyltransferase [Crenobacter sp. SG2305]